MKRKITWILVAIALCAVAVFLLNRPTQPKQTLEQKIAFRVASYLATCERGEEWWLSSGENLSDDQKFRVLLRISDMLAVAAHFKDVNAQTRRIYPYLKSAGWLVTTKLDVTADTLGAYVVKGGEMPTILLEAEDYVPWLMSKKRTPFAYRVEDKSIAIPAENMPPVFFAAMFYHEYGHGLQSMFDNLDADKERRGVIEVPMYTVSLDILKAGIPGYEGKIEEILQRRAYKDYKEAMAAVTIDDLSEFDGLIMEGNRHKYGGFSKYTVALNMYAIGFAFIDKHGGGVTQKYDAYEWLNDLGGHKPKPGAKHE